MTPSDAIKQLRNYADKFDGLGRTDAMILLDLCERQEEEIAYWRGWTGYSSADFVAATDAARARLVDAVEGAST